MLREIPEVLLVCDIVRSGDVSHIHVNLHGNSWNDLGHLNNLAIEDAWKTAGCTSHGSILP